MKTAFEIWFEYQKEFFDEMAEEMGNIVSARQLAESHFSIVSIEDEPELFPPSLLPHSISSFIEPSQSH